MMYSLRDRKGLFQMQDTHFQHIARVLWTRPMSTLGPKCVLKECLQGLDMAILWHQLHLRISPFQPYQGTSLARFDTPCHLLHRPRHPIQFQAHLEVKYGSRCCPLKVGPLDVRGARAPARGARHARDPGAGPPAAGSVPGAARRRARGPRPEGRGGRILPCALPC